MWKPEMFSVEEFRDGAVCLVCGNEGMETELAFSAQCETGEAGLQQQRDILEFIVKAVRAYGGVT